MNCLLWNCRGLGNPSTIRQLAWMTKQKRPDVVFLMETKLATNEWSNVLLQIGFDNLAVVDCDLSDGGRRGGLALIWADDIILTVHSSSSHHIHASIEDPCHLQWDFCGVYGWSNTDDHHFTWELMRNLKCQIAGRWLCGGDFNETMYHFEKIGGQPKSDSRLVSFRETVEDCGLNDLGFSGDPFTWTNNQNGDSRIMEHLDRCFGSEEWMLAFPGYEVTHLGRKSSDHCPIFLALDKSDEEAQQRPRPFRFEAMWLMWKQRSRADWMAEGDRNTGFFHRVAEGRKKRNHIKEIRREDGRMVRKHDEMDDVFRNHFQSLFKASTTHNPADVLRSIETVVTEDMNKILTVPYSQDEIVYSLKQMHPFKAPGSDGMPTIFYSACWSSAKYDIIPLLLSILNDGDCPRSLNSTFIYLIPKKRKCYIPTDYRPISLCNVVYKLISKVITDRLKLVLPSIIHESQSAFVPGRHITDNALLAFEIFHMMRINKAKKHGIFTFKLDMAKAYDRVEWGFLESMLLQLGFHVSVVDLIMRCVSSVFFRVLVNGFPGDMFVPGRGLRQGDPLSPFLFLFCAEALSGLLRKAESQNLIHGARLCRSAPRISHLLFADDCIIFGRANVNEVGIIRHTLELYEGVSGQKVNLDKSSISFSGGVVEEVKNEMAGLLGVSHQDQQGVYLGIPSTIGRSKNEIFQMLVDRTRKKSKDWKRRFLSGAGKMVLIKAEERRIHWKSWKNLCKPKYEGGLGFWDLCRFNQALLAKQVWRIIQNESSLLTHSLKARYFPRTNILLAGKAHNPSFAWTSLLVGRDLLENGIAWRLGDGARIRVGKDVWLPDGRGFYRTAQVPLGREDTRVQEMLDANAYEWDMLKVNNLLQDRDAWKMTVQMNIDTERRDMVFWPYDKSNIYTIKSGYFLEDAINKQKEASSSSSPDRSLWKWIWGLDVIPKVKLFLWRCITSALPTAEGLRRRSIDVDPLCRRCGEVAETDEHAFRDCKWVAFLWEVLSFRLVTTTTTNLSSIPQWVNEFREHNSREGHNIFATILWSIWYSRNQLVFNGKNIEHVDCLRITSRAVWTSPVSSQTTRMLPSASACSRAGQVKLWCDAAVKEQEGLGFGVIMQDTEGGLVGSRFGFIPGVFTAIEAEAMAVQEGIRFCEERLIQDAILVMDCQPLYWKLLKKVQDNSYLGQTLSEIHRKAAALYHLEFGWTPREGNDNVDRLAKFAIFHRSEPQSDEGCPVLLNSSSV
ncbi:uncharacterized protein LOC131022930 [Salvia miltiorrhiza]|uniref:uncharacterized protein LOC131022930 n=1 Tax=Salvia miltiorrhiza TaxID=226208 RepID=UPI0025AC024B|nr:uncharacterized protein LOC131022930 [Salvia miltiorrhiza]